MTAFEDPAPLDTERLLNELYAMQVSFRMLFDQLARTPEREWNRELLDSLLMTHRILELQEPSLRRH